MARCAALLMLSVLLVPTDARADGLPLHDTAASRSGTVNDAARPQEHGEPLPDVPVQLAGTMPLSRLVDLVSELTRTRYIYTPSELGEQVALRLPDEGRLSELQALLGQALHARGLTTVRAPGTADALLVVRLEHAASLATLTDASDASFVTMILPARSRQPADLADAARPLLSKQGNITVLSAGQGLLISERRDRLDELLPVLTALDAPRDAGLHHLPLEHLGSEDAAELLGQIVNGLASAGRARPRGEVLPDPAGHGLLLLAPEEALDAWRELVSHIDQPGPGEARAYPLRRYAPRDMISLLDAIGVGANVRLVPDEVTGGLLITAMPREHERLAALLARFDTSPESGATIRVFPIRNRAVGDVLGTLRTLIGTGGLATSRDADDTRQRVADAASQTSLAPAGPLLASPRSDAANAALSEDTQAISPAHGAAPGLSLTADQDTNSLLAIGSSRELAQVESLLEVLDRRQPQVMLEAILVSITESDALSLGVELDTITGSDATRVRLSSLLGLSASPPLSSPPSPGAGFSGLVLSPGDYAVLVRALESVTRGRSVSRPTVLVANNQQATFSSVLQQPITQQTRTGSNDTTFSFGGSDSAGTTISVRPQIAHADHLVLTYSIRLSSFVGQSSAVGLPPPKQETSVDSIATIPDGHTIVVGGLDLRTRSETDTGVPVLSRIPVLGSLFGQDTRGEGRTRFFVFIRATVLRSGAFTDLRHLSAQDASRAGLPPGAPVLEPRVIP